MTKRKRMMTVIPISLNTMILQKAMKTMKHKIKRHQMSLLMMILAGPLLMQRENVKLKRKG